MNRVFLLGGFVAVWLVVMSISEAAPESKSRLKRADSFLGIHFDFHAMEEHKEIGRTLTSEMVERMLQKVKPDYIQIDTKGHGGYSSYPTKVGYHGGSFAADSLNIWRRATARYGVALYAHHSGVYDALALVKNPDWARIDEKGQQDKNFVSVFGPYVDKLLVPQLKEIAGYGLDGVWVDGDCWGVQVDYSPTVVEAFKMKYNVSDVPKTPNDPLYYEFVEMNRQGYRDYLNRCITEVKKAYPDFQLCSNYAFSTLMPEAVGIETDWLSADFTPVDSYNSARLEGRLLRSHNRPWDLMAWGFSHVDPAVALDAAPFNHKSAVQLSQEAAAVLALGGGFQAYFRQKTDASIYEWPMEMMAEVAAFCRARQPYCHKAQPVPQAALLFSGESMYRKGAEISRAFGPWGDHGGGLLIPVRGCLQAVLDLQYSVDVLLEQYLAERVDSYPLVVIPEWHVLNTALKTRLLSYVKNGGNLLLLGPDAADLFTQEMDISWVKDKAKESRFLEHKGFFANVNTECRMARLGTTARSCGMLYGDFDVSEDKMPAASVTPYGKGKIAATYFNLGSLYVKSRTFAYRDFLGGLMHHLFPEPKVTVSGSPYVEVAINTLNGKLMVNLINTSGPHSDKTVRTFDTITPIGPLGVTIQTERQPTSVMLQPSGVKLDYTYHNSRVTVKIPQLIIHEVVVLD